MDRDFNNVFDIDDSFMKKILAETVKLEPPKDFDYDKLDKDNDAAKRR